MRNGLTVFNFHVKNLFSYADLIRVARVPKKKSKYSKIDPSATLHIAKSDLKLFGTVVGCIIAIVACFSLVRGFAVDSKGDYTIWIGWLGLVFFAPVFLLFSIG